MLPAPPGVAAPDSGFAPWPAPGPCAAARLMLSAKHAAAVEINNLLLIGKLSLDLVGGPSRNRFPSHVTTTSFAIASSDASRSMRELPAFLNWRSPRACCCATTDDDRWCVRNGSARYRFTGARMWNLRGPERCGSCRRILHC